MDIPDTKKFHSAVCQIETRASGMVWGPRSMGRALNFGVYEKVPPARKVPYDPSILIPLGINRPADFKSMLRSPSALRDSAIVLLIPSGINMEGSEGTFRAGGTFW